MAESDMLAAALEAAARGWRVFPVVAGKKRPPRLKDWGSRATNDPDVIASWWEKWPNDNVGIACGPSGLCVVDLDTKDGKDGPGTLADLEMMNGRIPDCPTAVSPTGGLHMYFSGGAATTVETIGPGIDTRSQGGQGGYVLYPGSRTTTGPYSWQSHAKMRPPPLPEWIRELAGRPRERRETDLTPATDLDTPDALAWAERHLTRDAKPSVEGERGNDTAFRVSCVLRDKAVSKEAAIPLMLEHYNPRCEPPWSEGELVAIVEHAYAYASVARPGGDTAAADFPDDLPPAPAQGPGETQNKADVDPRYRGAFDLWVWVAEPKWFVRRSDGRRLDEKSWNSLHNYLTESGQMSNQIFRAKAGMRKFTAFCFRPDEPEFVGELYNLWRPSGVEVREGGAPWLNDHVVYMLPDPREAQLCLDYLAWTVQRPKQKLSFALLMQGLQGTGKSWLGALMERLIGAHNTSRPSNDELHSDFNAWASGAQLVVIEELMTSGRREMANRLKTLITDPRVRVNEKHRAPYYIENRMNFLVFTNWEDPIPIDNDDRRYMVFMSPAEPREPAYYDALFAKLEDPIELGRALGELMARDLSEFKGQGRAPVTVAKERMRRASLSDAEAHLLDLFEAGAAPLHGSVVSAQDLIDALPDRLRRVARLHNVVGNFLRRELDALPLGQRRTPLGRRVLWAIRQHDVIERLTTGEQSDLYAKQMLRTEEREGSTGGDAVGDDFPDNVVPLRGE